jgi:hypothetical protein
VEIQFRQLDDLSIYNEELSGICEEIILGIDLQCRNAFSILQTNPIIDSSLFQPSLSQNHNLRSSIDQFMKNKKMVLKIIKNYVIKLYFFLSTSWSHIKIREKYDRYINFFIRFPCSQRPEFLHKEFELLYWKERKMKDIFIVI